MQEYSTTYARIIGAGKPTYWYAGQIGKIVEIQLRPEPAKSWAVCTHGLENGFYIDKEDVEQIPVSPEPARSKFARCTRYVKSGPFD